MNGFPAGSRDPSSQVSTGQKAVERGAQEVVQVDSGSEAEAPHTTPAEAQGGEATGTGEVPIDSFDMQACLNRGHPMVVEWDGRERDFIDGFGLCSPTRWHPASRGIRRTDKMKKLAHDTFTLLLDTVNRCIPDVRAEAFRLATGKLVESPFSQEALENLRKQWAGLLPDPVSALVVAEGQPFLLHGLAQWLEIFEDPDVDSLVNVEDSFSTGVPVGVLEPLPRTPQVFPPKLKHKKLDESEFNPLAVNYPSARVSVGDLEKVSGRRSVGQDVSYKAIGGSGEVWCRQGQGRGDGCDYKTRRFSPSSSRWDTQFRSIMQLCTRTRFNVLVPQKLRLQSGKRLSHVRLHLQFQQISEQLIGW